MLFEELCKIAAQNGNCRLVVSYSGDDRYALGISDGVSSPFVANGTLPELQAAVAEKLPGYLELAAREAVAKKAREEAARHEAELKAAEARRKQEAAARKAAEKKTIERRKQSRPGGIVPFLKNKWRIQSCPKPMEKLPKLVRANSFSTECSLPIPIRR